VIALLSPNADELGCRAELESAADLLERGTGVHRQLEVFERTGDLVGLVAEMADRTQP
jgi:gamma-glutamyl:cysteine ligase YbdK (ATP-grasp superfamily)